MLTYVAQSACDDAEYTAHSSHRGRRAIAWHLPDVKNKTLVYIVRAWQIQWPSNLPLAYPSPRNNMWLKKSPWIEAQVIPVLREPVRALILPPICSNE